MAVDMGKRILLFGGKARQGLGFDPVSGAVTGGLAGGGKIGISHCASMWSGY